MPIAACARRHLVFISETNSDGCVRLWYQERPVALMLDVLLRYVVLHPVLDVAHNVPRSVLEEGGDGGIGLVVARGRPRIVFQVPEEWHNRIHLGVGKVVHDHRNQLSMVWFCITCFPHRPAPKGISGTTANGLIYKHYSLTDDTKNTKDLLQGFKK